MILDKNLQFDPAATAITVTAVSTNVIDLQNARDIAVGTAWEPPCAFVTVGVAFAAVGAGTLRVQLQGSVDNITFTTYCQSDDIPKANLIAGAVIKLVASPQPPHAAGLPRYYRLNYVVTTGPFTAGQIEADLAAIAYQINNPPTYAPGVVVAN